ncbi:LysR family transcriptional regulator [Kineosporia succinea]|uniref:DNA-binding transcriptional LysR family regulator n=1 Tax=Kineosporia succinea TaxID=84632 RepID=A0ABT9P4N3_9ACTN|nr:LysR family transcriptional regulator [Kineosporia succinea]MDP9827649.1 DNA-binding transcriptional LysR family regulator [Kineosporia succinea]
MTDLDLRLVRYFVTVAEQQHFGRAAQQLLIGQPSLSRQIRRLEDAVGTRLLDRTSRGTRLTRAGEAFLPRAKALQRLADQAVGESRAAADPSRLNAGYIPGLVITPVVAEMRRRYPDAEIEARHVQWNTGRDALIEGLVDLVVARLPFRTEGLDVTVLYDEPRAAVMHRGHRLAGRESITMADIADEPVPQVPNWEFNDYWRMHPRPDGRPAPGGPVITSLEDKFEHVAAGEAIAIVPWAVHYGRPDLVGVPISDAAPGHVVMATRAGDRGRLVSAFRTWAQRLLPDPSVPPQREPRSQHIR